MSKKTEVDYIARIQNKLTFYGVLIDFYDDICERFYWRAESTKKNYMREYTNYIVRYLEGDEPKVIEEYTRDDYENALDTIDKEKNISDKRRLHYERLIYAVVSFASDRNLCQNVLWGTSYELPELDEKERIKELLTNKRSLLPIQDINLFKELTRDVKMDGERFGVFLMDVAGVRDAEASAVDFGDILESYNDSGIHVLMIYKTVESKEHKLISSGKTKNADRLIPLTDFVFNYLMERKKYIASELGVDINEVNNLPVACKQQKYKDRCLPGDISNSARVVFKKIGLQSKVLAFMDYELEYDRSPVIAKEKDPTAYLLRRNFVTQLAIAGFEEAEIQYLIGHDITDNYESRNEFIDIEKLKILSEKMKKRAIFSSSREEIAPNLEEEREYKVNSVSNCYLDLNLKKGEQVKLRFKSCEQNDKLTIEIKHNDNTITVSKRFTSSPSYNTNRTINIYNDYTRVYHSYQNKL